MPLAARRIFRLSLTTALTLVLAYAVNLPLPFIAPLFAFILCSAPAPPMPLKSLLGLVILVIVTSGTGLLIIPLLIHYPALALVLVALGLFISNYLSVNMGKGLVGTFLTVGIALISAAGMVSFSLSLVVIQALVLGIGLAILCQWIVYPWFPEDTVPAAKAKKKATSSTQSNWIALRATMIVFPVYLLVLTNPAMYLATIMKAVSLGQQGSEVNARNAGRELLGSTFMGGCFAILFWFALDLVTSLWMFFLWMVVFGIYFSSKLYGLSPSRYSGSFWVNTVVTMLILLGPAVEDSANGKDVYMAFFGRMGLFIGVTLYAWLAIQFLEDLRKWRHNKIFSPPTEST